MTRRCPFLSPGHLRALAAASLAALLALPGAALAQQDFSKVEIKTQQLSPTTYMLTGAGGNIGVSAGDDAVFIIDDQYAPLADKIAAALKAISPKPVRFVLNTHYHFDHTGGNEALGKAGALIVAHDNVRRRLTSDQLISFIGANQPKSPDIALPVVTVPGDINFHINGETVQAFHVPNAHTDGDLIVHFQGSDVVHMGDVYFNGFYPFIDSGSGGSADGVIAAADRVLALSTDKTQIIPGHGPLASRADLQAYRDMLATVTQRIRALRAEGKTDDEIRAAAPSADFDERWGKGFIRAERFVQMMLGAIPR